MFNRRLASVLILFLFSTATPSLFAQLAAPNERGISIGHVHLMVRDPDEHKKLWVGLLGAEVTHTGSLELLKLPGIFIIIGKAEPTGGSEGSTVNHFGFLVKNLTDMKAKLVAAHLEAVQDNSASTPKQYVVLFPDKVKVEFTEDPALTVPVAYHHIHIYSPDPESIRSWYVRTFGAQTDTRRGFPTAAFNGGEVNFAKSAEPTVPTKGRAVDHIGFEVKGLEAFCKKLQAEGVLFERPYADVPQIGLKIAFIVDPIGTRIELTEGLADH